MKKDARKTSPGTSSGESRVSPWVKAFVVVHLLGIVTWALPRPKKELTDGTARPFGSDYILVWGNQLRQIPPLGGYTQASGAWQYWDMFAPDPSNVDLWADAEVEFKDGTKTVVDYPRMYALDLYQKYLKERYRKFYERAGTAEHAYLWPTFAVQMARTAANDPANPPVAVTLRKHALPIAPPGKPQPTEYSTEIYYRYILRRGDLERGIK